MTPFDNIKTTFSFLTEDFGFILIETRQEKRFKGQYFLVYRNDNSKLQLEISANDNYFHCEIRRIINGNPAKYSDRENCIGFESLAVLESNNNYNHSDYFAGGEPRLTGVLTNTAALFQRQKTFFTKEIWIDTKRIKQLEDEDFEKTFGSKPIENNPTFFGELKKLATKLLTSIGFYLILDSVDLPPFDNDKIPENFIFQKDKILIKFSQQDWRDSYFIYYIKINDIKVFEIDITKQDLNSSIEQTMNYLMKWKEKNGY